MVRGCDLDDACAPIEETQAQRINFYSLRSLPDLLTNNRDDVFQYYDDSSLYRDLNPDAEFYANIFFSESEIQMQDNMFDIFEQDKLNQQFFEE